jgi:hypothetical protein
MKGNNQMARLIQTIAGTAVVAACVLGAAARSQADTNIVVLNSTSKGITVSCDNVGRIPAEGRTWSCLDATITTDFGGQRYTVQDTHGGGDKDSCGSGWDIRYRHGDANGKIIRDQCTYLGFGQIGCHLVEVKEYVDKKTGAHRVGLYVSVMPNDNYCAGVYIGQFSGSAVEGLKKAAEAGAFLTE